MKDVIKAAPLEPLQDWHSIRLEMRRPITVATKNVEKFNELNALWGDFRPPIVIAADAYPAVEEYGDTYELNAVLKAATLAEIWRGPALADDSGIEVEAIGWTPGVLSARTPSVHSSPQERNANILAALKERKHTDERRARFVCVCALVVPGYEPVIARGEVEGLIASAPAGSNGFGYDPIFYYPPYGATFGQVEPTKKHAVSHRGRAIRGLKTILASLVASR